eukprot:3004507-Prymnesium_polylepis.1
MKRIERSERWVGCREVGELPISRRRGEARRLAQPLPRRLRDYSRCWRRGQQRQQLLRQQEVADDVGLHDRLDAIHRLLPQVRRGAASSRIETE